MSWICKLTWSALRQFRSLKAGYQLLESGHFLCEASGSSALGAVLRECTTSLVVVWVTDIFTDSAFAAGSALAKIVVAFDAPDGALRDALRLSAKPLIPLTPQCAQTDLKNGFKARSGMP